MTTLINGMAPNDIAPPSRIGLITLASVPHRPGAGGLPAGHALGRLPARLEGRGTGKSHLDYQ